MKVPPLNLNPDISKIGISLPFSPDLLWRYPMAFPQTLPASPLHDVKNQMPTNLAADPRIWSREDVSYFLRWFEREFELPSIDISKFCMNGKALCMLTKTDLADRAPGAGDILHNTLQFLLRDSPQVPQSPITPQHPLLSPSPMTPTHGQGWPMVKSEIHNLSHLLQQAGSVTLSPAPSDQSGGSPRHTEPNANSTSFQNSSSSGPSGSDSEESTRDSSSPQMLNLPQYSNASSFSIQALASLKQLTDYQRAVASASAAQISSVKNEIPAAITSQSQQPFYPTPVQTQAMSDEPVETVTNGRLLWDFLQQLLNDKEQRYSQYIAWKNRETGVFKIVDPPGLARLWGIQKNHLSMNYDKMSRALRYYYRVNILRKVQGERHCYQFLRDPLELKSIKNLSLLRGAPIPSAKKWESSNNNTTTATVDDAVKKWEFSNNSTKATASVEDSKKWEFSNSNPTVMEEDEGPTDLSMSSIYPPFPGQNSQMSDPPVYTEPQNLVLDKCETFVKAEESTEK